MWPSPTCTWAFVTVFNIVCMPSENSSYYFMLASLRTVRFQFWSEQHFRNLLKLNLWKVFVFVSKNKLVPIVSRWFSINIFRFHFGKDCFHWYGSHKTNCPFSFHLFLYFGVSGISDTSKGWIHKKSPGNVMASVGTFSLPGWLSGPTVSMDNTQLNEWECLPFWLLLIDHDISLLTDSSRHRFTTSTAGVELW